MDKLQRILAGEDLEITAEEIRNSPLLEKIRGIARDLTNCEDRARAIRHGRRLEALIEGKQA